MHFELSEKEFQSLESCQQQISFMSDLCVYVEGAQSVSIVGLMHFLDAMKDALANVINAGEERQSEQIRQNAQLRIEAEAKGSQAFTINPSLMVRVMDVCSGVATSEEAVVKLYDELYDATVPNGEGDLLKSFHAALRRLGYVVNYSQSGEGTQFSIQRPRPKAVAGSAKKVTAPARKRAKDRLLASA